MNGKHTLQEYADYFRATDPYLFNEVFCALAMLEQRFIRTDFSSAAKAKLHEFPLLSEVLRRFSFEVQSYPDLIADRVKSPVNQFYLICEQGFSFGGNRYVYIFLAYNLLVNSNARLSIYNLPRNLNTFHYLPHLIASRFPSVSCFDIDKHLFSLDEITVLHQDIGINNMAKICLPELKEAFAIESSKEALALASVRFPEDSDLTILQRFSKVVNNRLSLPNYELINQYMPNGKELGSRPIALLCNRDSAYVGPSQPWRDSEIDNYDKSIMYLISQGFFVVRYNSCGKPSSVSHRHFIDLSDLSSCDQLLQLHIAASCKLIVGANTGVTGFAQTCSSAPTLYIDAPSLHAHSPWLKLISSPKRLEISNKDLIKRNEVYDLLLSPIWDYNLCAENGINLRPHDSDSILNEVVYFLDVVRSGKWTTVPSLRQISNGLPIKFNTMLTPSASINLSSLLLEADLQISGFL